jgi:hypothetical protein
VFDRKGDAVTFSAELRRREQLGTLTEMDMGRLTLTEYVVGTWCEAYASQLSPKTWMHYRQLLNKHLLPSLGSLELRAIRPETIGRWQAERLAAGHGRVSVRYALTLLGAILQRAFENGQIPSNPCASRSQGCASATDRGPAVRTSHDRTDARSKFTARRHPDQRPRLRWAQARRSTGAPVARRPRADDPRRARDIARRGKGHEDGRSPDGAVSCSRSP